MNGIKQPSGHPGGMQLFDAEGCRLYLTEDERSAFVAAKASREVRTFAACCMRPGAGFPKP
jgi:hypothetical protein